MMALVKGDFSPRGGSSPVLRFVLGFGVMVGALVFLGCPLRMVLRLAGGDVNALVGLVGFVAGILAGVVFFEKGLFLGRSYRQNKDEGLGLPIANVLLFWSCCSPLLPFSFQCGGSWLSSCPPSRLSDRRSCRGCRRTAHTPLHGGWYPGCGALPRLDPLSGFLAIFVVTLIGNTALGNFHLSWLISQWPTRTVSGTSWVWPLSASAPSFWAAALSAS